MARGMNRVTIIGFVERDPEMRRTASRQPVASFPVSTNRRWTTNSGEDREATEWFNIVAWGDLAEAVVRLVQKDRRIYAEGHLQSRTWQDARGQRHVRTEMVASQMIPMDDRETIANRDPDVENEKMPLCLNRVMVIGNLGRDPEMRYTPEGQALTSFNLATSRTWISANGGRRDSTEWFKVVSWGSLAEICKKHLKKGRRVYIEGELRTRGWQQPDGNKLFRTELVANEMILLGPRPKSRLGDHDGDEFKHEPPL
ncbi:MAG: single-stranded DNA-binding protein [Anaerolineae bacterium]|jgi:single-strand DNA-binding protein